VISEKLLQNKTTQLYSTASATLKHLVFTAKVHFCNKRFIQKYQALNLSSSFVTAFIFIFYFFLLLFFISITMAN